MGIENRRARAYHRCDLCFQLIEPGEDYTRQTTPPGEWDGDYWHTTVGCRWCCVRFVKYLQGGDEGTPWDWVSTEAEHWLWLAGVAIERGGLYAALEPLRKAQDEAKKRMDALLHARLVAKR